MDKDTCQCGHAKCFHYETIKCCNKSGCDCRVYTAAETVSVDPAGPATELARSRAKADFLFDVCTTITQVVWNSAVALAALYYLLRG